VSILLFSDDREQSWNKLFTIKSHIPIDELSFECVSRPLDHDVRNVKVQWKADNEAMENVKQ
jgi:hypothetical protein